MKKEVKKLELKKVAISKLEMNKVKGGNGLTQGDCRDTTFDVACHRN